MDKDFLCKDDDDFIKLIEKFLDNSNISSLTPILEKLLSLNKLTNFISNNINSLFKFINQQYGNQFFETQEKVEKIKLVDVLLILKASSKSFLINESFVKSLLEVENLSKLNISYLKDIFILNLEDTEKYEQFKRHLNNDLLNNYNNGNKNKNISTHNLSNLPSSKINDNISQQIYKYSDCSENNVIFDCEICIYEKLKYNPTLLIKGESGIGKSINVSIWAHKYGVFYDKMYGCKIENEEKSLENYILEIINFYNKDLNSPIDKKYIENNKNLLEESIDFLINTLVEILNNNNYLLIIDDVHKLLNSDQEEQLKKFYEELNKLSNSKSKVIFTSQKSIKNSYKQITIQNLKEEAIIKILKSKYDFIQDYIAREYSNILSKPIYLYYILTQKSLNDVDQHIEIILEKIGDNINDYILEKLSKNLQYIAFILSVIITPVSDNMLNGIIKNLRKKGIYLEDEDKLKKEILETGFIKFDDRDRGKYDVTNGTYEMHDKYMNYFNKKLKEDSNYEKIILSIAEYLEDTYKDKESLKKYNFTNSLRIENALYIIKALKFYLKIGDFDKLLEIAVNKINNNEPISLGLHQNIYNVLKTIDLEKILPSIDNKKNIYPFLKLYRFLLTTLNKTKKAYDISKCYLETITEYISLYINEEQIDLSNYQKKYNFLKNNNVTKEDIKNIEILDWLIMSLEVYKYNNKIDENSIEQIEQEYEKIENNTNNYIYKFWDFLYKQRLKECKRMTSNCCDIEKKGIEDCFNEFIQTQQEELDIIKAPVDKLSNDEQNNYAKHPHIIWRERFIAHILEQVIDYSFNFNQPINNRNNNIINEIEDIVNTYIEIYKLHKRAAYTTICYINLIKLQYLNSTHPNFNYNQYDKIKVKIIKETKEAGKKDFEIEVLLNLAFSDYKILNNKKYFEALRGTYDNISIYFYKVEYEILEKLIENKHTLKELENRCNNWCYLKNKLTFLPKES